MSEEVKLDNINDENSNIEMSNEVASPQSDVNEPQDIYSLGNGEEPRASESNVADEALEPSKPKRKRIRWTSHTFEHQLPPLELFDLEPVSDIPIRQAVEEKAIKNKRDLNIFITTSEWNDLEKGAIVVAAKIEEGEPYALWHASPKRSLQSATIAENPAISDEDPSVPAQDHEIALQNESE